MIKKISISLLSILVLAVALWLIARPYRVSGDCMEPAVKDGQRCFLNQLLPYLRDYKINDIILFNHEDRTWISRIVALENDTLEITEGSILINNVPLKDNIQRNWADWQFGEYAINKPLLVPLNHVYVLSDNLTAHHDDSRVFGPISKKSILGIVWSWN